MSNIIIDTVDYDYPSCGGITVSRGKKYYTVEVNSNYQGNRTGLRYRLDITPVRDSWTEDDWTEVIDNIYAYRDAVRINRGILVQ